MPQPLFAERGRRPLDRWVRDDVAYVLPMGVFFLLTWVGGKWPAVFPVSYVVKTVAAGLLLVLLRRHYTAIRWNWLWLGLLVGLIGTVQWIGMEKLLLHYWPSYPRPDLPEFNPFRDIGSPGMRWTFLAVRLAGPALVVPVMEELFWRDFLWRSVISPYDFKLASVGEWQKGAFAVVTLLFAFEHVQWITAIVWGAMIAWLLVRTRSLGACIIAHAVTNLLLGLYVLHTHEWFFW